MKVSGKKSKKAIFIIVAVVILIFAIIAFIVVKSGEKGKSGKEEVYAEKVSDILKQETGSNNSYSGVVEAETSQEIKKDSSKEIKEVYVKEGDTVKEGTPLFSYDTSEAENAIAEAQLDLESSDNEISGYNSQIKDLEAQRGEASDDQKLEYTSQIQEIQGQIKEAEYNKESKKAEIEKNQKAVDGGIVKSNIVGIVKTINNSSADEEQDSSAYMVILQNDKYKVKGQIEEETVGNIKKGQKVVVRSRIDETKTWKGKISSIDTENVKKESSSDMEGEGEESRESSTKYPFYVELEDSTNLLLGQHVFIDTNPESVKESDGIWLDASYVVEDNDTYIWVANSKNKLEKRKVKIGKIDDNTGKYQIKSGLSKNDYIVWNSGDLHEGASITKTDESASN